MPLSDIIRRLKPLLHTRSPPARTKESTRYQAEPGNADSEALPPILLFDIYGVRLMSKSLFFQFLLTATPAFFCIDLLHFSASYAAENSVSETEEATAPIVELPVVEFGIAPIDTQINPAAKPEITAEIELEQLPQSENIAVATDSEQVKVFSQENEIKQTETAAQASGESKELAESIQTPENPTNIAEIPQAESIQTPENPVNIAEISQTDSLETNDAGEIEQVTSVSQLSDVKPTDWAFQALQSLVERYGCIAGYPDGTFRGNRAMTRYEFAAGLNACLDKVAELVTAGTSNLVKKDDLVQLQKLQEEFAAELATLRGRIDVLEARTANLEADQFSTTTKLNATVWFNLTSAFPTGDITAERSRTTPNSAFAPPTRDANNRPTRVDRDRPETTFSYYAFLTLNTSFTGKDSLITQLVFGNGNSPANELVSAGFFNTWGTPFLDQTGVPTANVVAIREMSYTFPVGDRVQVSIGPRLNYYRYFDNNRFTFFLRGATSFNSNGSTLLNAVDRGSGAAVNVTIRDERCMMINLDPDTAKQDPRVMKAVVRLNKNNAGAYGTVARTGSSRSNGNSNIFDFSVCWSNVSPSMNTKSAVRPTSTWATRSTSQLR